MSAKRPCAHEACAELVERGQRRCARHKRRHLFQVNRYRRDEKLNLYTWRWTQTSRARLLEFPWCSYCPRPADVTDHVIPHRGNPDLFWDANNWQSLCKRCHDRKTMEEKNIAPDGARARRVLVCGPPGSGKSTYVKQRAKYGDVILDFDELFATVAGLPVYDKPRYLIPVVLAMRDAAIEAAAKNTDPAMGTVWIIALAPRAEHRAALVRGGKVIVIECEADICIGRIQADARRARFAFNEWSTLARDWWNEYERNESDEIVVW